MHSIIRTKGQRKKDSQQWYKCAVNCWMFQRRPIFRCIQYRLHNPTYFAVRTSCASFCGTFS